MINDDDEAELEQRGAFDGIATPHGEIASPHHGRRLLPLPGEPGYRRALHGVPYPVRCAWPVGSFDGVVETVAPTPPWNPSGHAVACTRERCVQPCPRLRSPRT